MEWFGFLSPASWDISDFQLPTLSIYTNLTHTSICIPFVTSLIELLQHFTELCRKMCPWFPQYSQSVFLRNCQDRYCTMLSSGGHAVYYCRQEVEWFCSRRYPKKKMGKPTDAWNSKSTSHFPMIWRNNDTLVSLPQITPDLWCCQSNFCTENARLSLSFNQARGLVTRWGRGLPVLEESATFTPTLTRLAPWPSCS